MTTKNKVNKQLKKEDKRAARKELKRMKKSSKAGKKTAKLFIKFHRAFKKMLDDETAVQTFLQKADTKKTSTLWIASAMQGITRKKKTLVKVTKKKAA